MKQKVFIAFLCFAFSYLDAKEGRSPLGQSEDRQGMLKEVSESWNSPRIVVPVDSETKETRGLTLKNRTFDEIYDPLLATVKIYRFIGNYETEWFGFSWGKDGGYRLWDKQASEVIQDNIHYVKTFGGTAPTISIILINDRFLVYPETVQDSLIKQTPYFDRMAATKVYDLNSEKIIIKSESYQYDHDIELRYSVREIFQASNQTVQPNDADNPVNSPENPKNQPDD